MTSLAPATELLPMNWIRSSGTSGSSPMVMQLEMSSLLPNAPAM